MTFPSMHFKAFDPRIRAFCSAGTVEAEGILLGGCIGVGFELGGFDSCVLICMNYDF